MDQLGLPGGSVVKNPPTNAEDTVDLSKPGRLVVQLLGGVQLFATTPWTVVH